MTEHSGGVTKRLLERLLNAQRRSAEKERKMSYAEKLRILDSLMEQQRQVKMPIVRHKREV